MTLPTLGIAGLSSLVTNFDRLSLTGIEHYHSVQKIGSDSKHFTFSSYDEGHCQTRERAMPSKHEGSSIIQSPGSSPPIPVLDDGSWSVPSCPWEGSGDMFESGDITSAAGLSLPIDPSRSRCRVSASQLLKTWLRLRWQLSRRFFSVQIPFLTAELDIKVGDFVVTFPALLTLLAISALQASHRDVKGSGIPPGIVLAAAFVFVVRNNSLLVVLTGISYERALFYHKLCGFVMIILTALHGLAYILLRKEGSGEVDKNAKVFTGMVAFIAMITLYLLSLGCVRRRFHELFVKMHWILFIVIIVAAVSHGAIIALVGVLPWEFDMIYRLVYRTWVYSRGSVFTKIARPSSTDSFISNTNQYANKNPKKPMGVAALDRMCIFQLPDDITCIQFPRVRHTTDEEFKYKAGQYAFLCIPSLSLTEWHPFCVSSSPHENLVVFHVKAVGDWTMNVLQASPEIEIEGAAPFDVLIDGPYGNLSIDIEDPGTYSHFVVFAGEMGIAPMRSIINWLFNECFVRKARTIRRLHFVWSVGDSETLQAFMSVDEDRWMNDPRAPYLPDILLCPTTLNTSTETFYTEIFLTRGLVGAQTELDPQLSKCLSCHCRPDIERILREMGIQAAQNGKTRVAVLVCGPESMASEVIATSLKLSQEMNLHFDVHCERFAL